MKRLLSGLSIPVALFLVHCGNADADLAAEIVDGCGQAAPCGEVRLNCGKDRWGEDCTEPYGEATQCALERLAAGEAFALHFDINGLNGEEEWSDFVFDGAGAAVRVDSIRNSGGSGLASSDPVTCTLASPETFQSCLSVANDDPLHAQCMLFDSWFADCSAKASSCPE